MVVLFALHSKFIIGIEVSKEWVCLMLGYGCRGRSKKDILCVGRIYKKEIQQILRHLRYYPPYPVLGVQLVLLLWANHFYLLNQMQSNQSVMQPNRNFFSLNRLHADCYYPPIRVDFNSNPTLKTANNSILPVYNHDSHFFTPTFLLPSEKTYFSNNCSSERLKFAEKVNAELSRSGHEQSKASELGLLSSESKYCQICQMKFEDYWRHVAEKSHQRKMHLSQSNLHIRDLCQAFHANTPKAAQSGLSCEVEPRRGRKPKNNHKGVERCISEEMLKAVQGNCSTQILLGNQQQGL